MIEFLSNFLLLNAESSWEQPNIFAEIVRYILVITAAFVFVFTLSRTIYNIKEKKEQKQNEKNEKAVQENKKAD